MRYAVPDSGAERPPDEEDPDLPAAVLAALREITAAAGPIGRGDVLVFLPGEREIRDVAELLERELESDAEILPLYSRLAWEQQRRIFERGSRQRIVLATNVAETSITVPGIRAVIDSGLARISRYSPRNRLQRLPIERDIARERADSARDAAGALGPGVCVRLYSEVGFRVARRQFTEPEVLRTNLAALLLRLAADGLGAAEGFPFIDPPDSRALNDGYRLLQELEALDAERRITRRGPRDGAAAHRSAAGPRAAREQALSRRGEIARDRGGAVACRTRASARRQAARRGCHAAALRSTRGRPNRNSPRWCKLWRALPQGARGNAARTAALVQGAQPVAAAAVGMGGRHGRSPIAPPEIGIVRQRRAGELRGRAPSTARGVLHHGRRARRGGRVSRARAAFGSISFPDSPLKRRKPRWVMAANIVETSRVYARRVAEIEPSWIEAAAQGI